VAAQVLGVVGIDGTGLEGLEHEYQDLLAGRPGDEAVQEDRQGTLIPQAGQSLTPPVAGSDLVLTIDADVQYRAQAALAQAVKSNHAHGGTIMVMDPHSGQILAMASTPSFNPNDFTASPWESRQNRAVTASYEPGSVNKVIAAAAALESRTVNLKDRFTVPYAMQIYDHVFHDAEPHPTRIMNLADILAYSSNIGMIQIAENRLNPGLLSSYLHAFGLGSRTGVGFPGEASGILPPAGTWSGTSVPTIAIGQGVAVTPLQMAAVYATIANGGVWVQPSLVRGTVDPGGTFHAARRASTRQVISPETAATLTRMLAYAVDVGTGQEAQIPGFWVAGKTGTARIPLPQGGGYYTDRYEASFIGFAPAVNPAVEVAVVIDEPTTVFGGIAAAPLFQEVERFALARLRVPPEARLPEPMHLIPTG
jgi:cell division protein FtsI (penicillin-binding protein 3)